MLSSSGLDTHLYYLWFTLVVPCISAFPSLIQEAMHTLDKKWIIEVIHSELNPLTCS